MPGAELPTIATLAYLTIFAISALDIFLPPLPSDGLVIAGAAVAVHGNLDLPLVILAAAAGSWTGDLACYGLGRWFGGSRWAQGLSHPRWLRVPARLRRSAGAGPGRVAVMRERLRTAVPELFRGHVLVVLAACRLMPGGRTIGAATAGRIALPLRRFLLAEIVVGAAWATQQSAIGYLSGSLLPSNISIAGLLPAAEIVLTLIALTVGARILSGMVRSVPVPGQPVPLRRARRLGVPRAKLRCARQHRRQAQLELNLDPVQLRDAA